MNVEFLHAFERDLVKLDPITGRKLKRLIEQVRSARSLDEVPHVTKLKGHSTAFRIRIGDHRVGVFVDTDLVQFARVLHRKDIYRMFP